MPDPISFDWTKADRYAQNFVLIKLMDLAEAQEKLAAVESPPRFKETAEQRAYAFRAAIMKLSREDGE